MTAEIRFLVTVVKVIDNEKLKLPWHSSLIADFFFFFKSMRLSFGCLKAVRGKLH